MAKSKAKKVLIVYSINAKGEHISLKAFNPKEFEKADEYFKKCVRDLDDVFGDDMDSCVQDGCFYCPNGRVLMKESLFDEETAKTLRKN